MQAAAGHRERPRRGADPVGGPEEQKRGPADVQAAEVEVDSSSIEAVGYDAAMQVQLCVWFVDCSTSAYSPVAARLHGELLRADSKGRFVNYRIKLCFAVGPV